MYSSSPTWKLVNSVGYNEQIDGKKEGWLKENSVD